MAERGSNGDTLGGQRQSDSQSPGSSPQKEKKPSSKSKDPSRPKRKKARRACAACQRAHLTCGDERPCERCIKRGLQDDCHDGARKKAKYLRDAPDEALQPGAARFFQHNKSAGSPTGTATTVQSNLNPGSVHITDGGFLENTQQNLAAFPAMPPASQRLSQSQDAPTFNQFVPPPVSMRQQPFNPPPDTSAQHMPSNYPPALDNQTFMGSFPDPNEANLSSFDPSSVNFGNQYGALEFGMLGHMASGANNYTGHRSSSGYDGSAMLPSAYGNANHDMSTYSAGRQGSTTDWNPNDPRLNSWAGSKGTMDAFPGGRDEPTTYSIGNPYMGASPISSTTDFMAPFEITDPDNTYSSLPRKTSYVQSPHNQRPHSEPQARQEREHRPSKAVSRKLEQLPAAKTTAQRRSNASKIYQSVIKPYPYTARFHALIAVISRRFKSQKRLRIAKALGSIRPSFISCTRTLIEEDLILMEKNFQRSLLEYRDHVSSCGTPTIICRRTGEVAYCGESFLELSGWPVGVLLGKEPNLNINRGGDEEVPSGTMTGSSRGGINTPRVTTAGVDPSSAVPHPVFLTDLLDDDSVVQFYEDFAKIAYTDSKGSACRPCKVLKYKTKDDPLFSGNRFEDNGGVAPRRGPRSAPKPDKPQPAPAQVQQDISRLGQDDGLVDCMFCWTVKRDVFEFPMMVVINVSTE